MSRLAFEFLKIEVRPGKPRRTGLTAVRDRMRSLDEQRAFLETYAQFVDFAKISNLSPRLYPEQLLKSKLALYTAHEVVPFFGGILFENALAQGKTDQLIAYLLELGAPAIEISNNILDLDALEVADHIDRFAKQGITVFAEWGEKYPNRVLNPETTAKEMSAWIDAGATHVILERSEIELLLEASDGLGRLTHLSDLVGNERLIFEAETQDQCVALLDGLGGDVSLGPNIDFELVKWLEPSRIGISREMGHKTIESAAGRKAVRSRLNSEKNR